MSETPKHVPNVTLKTRVRDESIGGDNPFDWKDLSTGEFFKDRTVVVFSLPGAFTPTCSSSHLPRYDELYADFQAQGVDEIACISVNDAFVMYKWGLDQSNKNITLLPDGSGAFTKEMGMLVKKDNLGFGERSWRYSMLVVNGEIVKLFSEAGFVDDCPTDPFEVSDADTMLTYLKETRKSKAA
jgi:peroxiredoxin